MAGGSIHRRLLHGDGVAAAERHGAAGVIPRWFGRVHAGRRTPRAGILLSGSLAAVLVVIGDLETLADTTVLLLLFAFVAVPASVLVLQRTPVDHEHFTARTGFPVLGGCAAPP
jgi:basic amino acid/polyamine antiporter, APA family